MILDLPELAELKTAEEFLDHFGIAYDRLAIGPLRVPTLRLFKNYVAAAAWVADIDARRNALKQCLTQAYQDAAGRAAGASTDTVASERASTFVPLSAISDGLPR